MVLDLGLNSPDPTLDPDSDPTHKKKPRSVSKPQGTPYPKPSLKAISGSISDPHEKKPNIDPTFKLENRIQIRHFRKTGSGSNLEIITLDFYLYIYGK